MAVWYCGSTKHTAVAQWAANTAYGAGSIVRQLAAPAVGSERCFRTAAGGTSHATIEPVWVLTKGSASPADGTITDWTEITGDDAYNAPNDFAAPGARLRLFLNGASSWMAAGDTCYVSNNHAATEAVGITLTSPGTDAAPCYVLCIDDTQATATLATGARETTTAFGSITLLGSAYCYEVSFYSGGSIGLVNGGAGGTWSFDSLTLSTSSGGYVLSGKYGNDDASVVLKNVTVSLSGTSTYVNSACRFVWIGGAIAGTVPTGGLLQSGYGGEFSVRGVDLSALGTNPIVNVSSATLARCLLVSCKLGTNWVAVTGTHPGPGGWIVELVNCHSGANNYTYYYNDYQGTITQETTIVRTGGASDGTTPISRKMVSTANACFVSPLVLDCIAVWNETTGSALTATVEVITDNVTLTDAQAWVEVEYLGSAATPISSFVSDRAANILATPANQAASVVDWEGTGGMGTPVKQKFVSPAFTPQMKGPIKVRVMLAKASTTMYACPKVTVA